MIRTIAGVSASLFPWRVCSKRSIDLSTATHRDTSPTLSASAPGRQTKTKTTTPRFGEPRRGRSLDSALRCRAALAAPLPARSRSRIGSRRSYRWTRQHTSRSDLEIYRLWSPKPFGDVPHSSSRSVRRENLHRVLKRPDAVDHIQHQLQKSDREVRRTTRLYRIPRRAARTIIARSASSSTHTLISCASGYLANKIDVSSSAEVLSGSHSRMRCLCTARSHSRHQVRSMACPAHHSTAASYLHQGQITRTTAPPSRTG